MTAVAILRRRYVVDRLSVERVGDRIELAIVATFAATGNAGMHTKPERRRPEIRYRVVAHAAFFLRRYMTD